MYTVTGIPLTRTFRVLWALEELGEPYELNQHGPRSPEVQALNVSGKVPVLRHEGRLLTESHAICEYLDCQPGDILGFEPARSK